MKHVPYLFFVLCLSGVVIGCQQQAAQQPPAPPPGAPMGGPPPTAQPQAVSSTPAAQVLAKATADKAAQGQKIYEAQQCSRCHSIAGVGSPRGRALDKVGATRQGEWLVEHFRNPSAMTPNSRMPPVNLSDDDMAALTAYMLSLK